jgi:hypothetical protein
MSSKPLAHLTDKPDFSSAGASRINFIDPCGPRTFHWLRLDEPVREHFRVRFPLCSQPGRKWAFLEICHPSWPEEDAWSEADLNRLGCHVLIQQLPDESLSEAVESLAEMYESYARLPAPYAALPQPAPQPIKVKSLGTRDETYPSVLELD